MIILIRTCNACPEQYDALNEQNETIGYLRLRHGTFTVECPDVGESEVYTKETLSDGIFEDDERCEELTNAVKAIQKYYNLDENGQFKLVDEWK